MKTIALFALIALCANSAHAGLFSRLFGCRGGSCAKPAVKAKAPQSSCYMNAQGQWVCPLKKAK